LSVLSAVIGLIAQIDRRHADWTPATKAVSDGHFRVSASTPRHDVSENSVRKILLQRQKACTTIARTPFLDQV
jgi:hypothetical protein